MTEDEESPSDSTVSRIVPVWLGRGRTRACAQPLNVRRVGWWKSAKSVSSPLSVATISPGPSWEKVTGSDPISADNNDDPDRDGYTLLENYLEFMAHPYLVIQPNTSGTIDLKAHFAGFYGQNGKSATPTFSLEDQIGYGTIVPSINGSTLTIQAIQPDTQGISYVNVTVDDGETTFTQRFGIAITADVSKAISPAWDESSIQVKSREFFTLDGKKVTTLRAQETYVMRVTDSEDHTHSFKIIKN